MGFDNFSTLPFNEIRNMKFNLLKTFKLSTKFCTNHLCNGESPQNFSLKQNFIIYKQPADNQSNKNISVTNIIGHLLTRFSQGMNDGFQLVKSRRKEKKIRKDYTGSLKEIIVDSAPTNLAVLLRKIKSDKDDIEQSSYFKNLQHIINTHLPDISDILCYGLGNFSECHLARTQFGLLLALKDRFRCSVTAYDPRFTPTELTCLEHFSVETIKVNEEGKHSLSPNKNTLAFFPHCPKQLVNNFLWANWNPVLHNCVIISNSFTNIVERNIKSVLATIDCIKDIVSITNEVPVPDNYEIPSVFNDLSLHSFPKNKVGNIEFWCPRDEPKYPTDDLELITKDIAVKFSSLTLSNDGFQ